MLQPGTRIVTVPCPVNMFERWLLESVLIRGWTTLKCARTMKSDKWPCGAKPETILEEFNRLVEGN